MKAVEAVKEKFYCFLGIVHPTVYNTVGEPDYAGPQNPDFLTDAPPLQHLGFPQSLWPHKFGSKCSNILEICK